jgi:hypothetical protein
MNGLAMHAAVLQIRGTGTCLAVDWATQFRLHTEVMELNNITVFNDLWAIVRKRC